MGLLSKFFRKTESTNSQNKQKTSPPKMKNITLQVNDKCRPIRRGELYREPLDDFLERKGIGEVEGGGSQLQKNGEIAYCDLEIILNDDSDSIIEELKIEIERIEVPKGSLLIVNDKKIPVGTLTGVGVYFRYNEVPEEIFKKVDIDNFWDGIGDAIKPDGKFHDYWQGKELCAFYYYGKDAEPIIKAVRKKLKGHSFEPYIDPLALPKKIE